MAVYLATYEGVAGSGDERFTHTLAIDAPGPGGASQSEVLTAAVDGLEAAAAVTNFLAQFPAGVIWDRVSVAEVTNLTTGTLNAKVSETVNIVATGSGATGHAPQIAVAVSLTAGTRPNGSPLRGRFYLPRPTTGAAPNGFLTTTAQDILGAGMVALVEGIDTAVPAITPVVWSRTLGVTQDLTQLRIGRVVDTIRSRRAQLAEQYGADYLP